MSDNSAPYARPSSTVVVVREGAIAPELLLVRRRAGDAFGDSYAFPGGVVDSDESNAHEFITGRAADEADNILQVDDALIFYSAAIRELFEETGILIARNINGTWARDGSSFGDLRQKVDCGALAWRDFLRQQNLQMAGDALHYFAHWETPNSRPKRWTTRFFMAELPPNQVVMHDGTEITDSRWISANDALALEIQGEFPMPFPTIRNLQSMAHLESVAALIQWAKDRPSAGISMIRPVLVTDNGKELPLIPGDAGYLDAVKK